MTAPDLATPRTDAEVAANFKWSNGFGSEPYIPVKFARQLERELASRALNDSPKDDGHGWDLATLEHCARLIEKRAEARQLADCHLDPDTGAMEYPSYAKDIGNALDEEAEDCAKIIRALPARKA